MREAENAVHNQRPKGSSVHDEANRTLEGSASPAQMQAGTHQKYLSLAILAQADQR